MNSKWHFYISAIKSIIRITGCFMALDYNQWEIMVIALPKC